jgi:L-rhamnose mutarotase
LRKIEVGSLQRYAQVIRLSADAEAEYIRYHERVWPEVLATIAACQIRNYSIFLRKGVLFAYFEYHGADYAADMRKMAADPQTQKWWLITDAMQLPMEDAEPGEKWSPMREVFHFEPKGGLGMPVHGSGAGVEMRVESEA